MTDELATLSVTDVARLSGLSEKTVLRALAAGELAGSKVRNRWMVWRDDYRAWINSGRRSAGPGIEDQSPRMPVAGSAERLRAIEEAA